MELGKPLIVETNRINWEELSQPWYSKPIQRKVLRRDSESGATDLLIRYPAGLVAPIHRHTYAHAIFVLEHELIINDKEYPTGTYAYFPAGELMSHVAPPERDCLFLICFEGPPDFIIAERY
jgi:quercetin dioxygenase-like cupin family protein